MMSNTFSRKRCRSLGFQTSA